MERPDGYKGLVATYGLRFAGQPRLMDLGLLTRALKDHLRAYLRAWNQNPTPFEWTKPARAIIKSHKRMLDRISTAVH